MARYSTKKSATIVPQTVVVEQQRLFVYSRKEGAVDAGRGDDEQFFSRSSHQVEDMVRCLVAGLPCIAVVVLLIALGAVTISFTASQPWREAKKTGGNTIFALADSGSHHNNNGLQDRHHQEEERARVLEAIEEEGEEGGPSLDISRVGSPRSNGCADFDLSVLLKGRGCGAPLSEPCFNLDR